MNSSSRMLHRVTQRVKARQLDVLWYSLRTRFQGLDFSPASAESLGLDPQEAVHHSNSGGPILASVLEQISIPKGSRVVDFGSGKGGATFTLAQFPFDEVLGIELSPELVAIANRNRAILGANQVNFSCCSATELREDLDRFSHAYFFNPFSPAIFREVYQNLCDSITRQPRPFTVVCMHPGDGSIVECFPESDTFKLVRRFDFPLSHPFYVFQH